MDEVDVFLMTFQKMQKAVHLTAKEKGWWDEPREDGTMIALIHSELSEALEGLRINNPPSDKIPEFTQAEEELADVIIRIMDMAEYHEWNIAEAFVSKLEYNLGREHRHGGKEF